MSTADAEPKTHLSATTLTAAPSTTARYRPPSHRNLDEARYRQRRFMGQKQEGTPFNGVRE